MPRTSELDPKSKSTFDAVHFNLPVDRSNPTYSPSDVDACGHPDIRPRPRAATQPKTAQIFGKCEVAKVLFGALPRVKIHRENFNLVVPHFPSKTFISFSGKLLS